MQERALLPKFAVEEYFSQIFRKDLATIVELSPVMVLLLFPLIMFDNKLITATTNEMLAIDTSIPDMRMSVFYLQRVEAFVCTL